MEQNKKLRVVEFFGGISAARKALIRQKIPHKIVDYVEIDGSAVKSYNAIYDDNFKPQDITKWDKDLDDIDLMIHRESLSECIISEVNKKVLMKVQELGLA